MHPVPVVNPLARCPPNCYACPIPPFSLCCSKLTFSPPRTPENNFDVHVLRTFTRELTGWIVPLQTSSPQASDTINEVIFALNYTFHEVELAYMDWRNYRVQTVLQHGIFLLFFPPPYQKK